MFIVLDLFFLWIFKLGVDLVILNMIDFEVILGMIWLSPYYVVLNCNARIVTLKILGRKM